MPENPSQPLLKIAIGGITLSAGLLIASAIALFVMQVMGLLDGINPEKSLLVQCVPGLLGLACLLLGILMARRKGELRIFKHRVEGRRTNGLPFDVALAEVATVEIKAYSLALLDGQGKLLLLLGRLPKQVSGLVWLLKAYGEWDAAIWTAYGSSDAVDFPKATRHFHADAETVSLSDIGFLVPVGADEWYFPESRLVDVGRLGAGQLRMNQRATGQAGTALQLQPQPDLIPLERFLGALLGARLSANVLLECVAELSENHGGNRVAAGEDADSQEFDGECLGYGVRIYRA